MGIVTNGWLCAVSIGDVQLLDSNSNESDSFLYIDQIQLLTRICHKNIVDFDLFPISILDRNSNKLSLDDR